MQDNKCRKKELYEGIEIAGNLHSYRLTNLEPEVHYRISIRACVADIENNCGPETIFQALTFSKKVEEVLRSVQN